MEITQSEAYGIISDIINCFGSLLDEYKIKLPQSEREKIEYTDDKEEQNGLATVFGSDYYSLEDQIMEILKQRLEVAVIDTPNQ
jgi:hypothetical protein